jgi:hypothetical protein
VSEHQGSTDQVHKIELSSVISQAMWDRSAAWAGQNVELLVYTEFVGNGSESGEIDSKVGGRYRTRQRKLSTSRRN